MYQVIIHTTVVEVLFFLSTFPFACSIAIITILYGYIIQYWLTCHPSLSLPHSFSLTLCTQGFPHQITHITRVHPYILSLRTSHSVLLLLSHFLSLFYSLLVWAHQWFHPRGITRCNCPCDVFLPATRHPLDPLFTLNHTWHNCASSPPPSSLPPDILDIAFHCNN